MVIVVNYLKNLKTVKDYLFEKIITKILNFNQFINLSLF